MQQVKTKKLSHPVLLKINQDPVQAAKVANLVYVAGEDEGISRVTRGKRSGYFLHGSAVKDKAVLERIQKLAIPPSWTNVWICTSAQGHIQATGVDLKGRKQYRYHAKWNELRNETKFHHLYEFGKTLPLLRKRIKRDMAGKNLTREKVLATVIDLMDKTYIRVGNAGYEKANGSYGLTTLKDKHVKIAKEEMLFSFTGKKGVEHTIKLRNKRLARIVKECRDIPGRTLFQYYDGEGNKRSIDSGMVNSYIREAAGGKDFSAKDFRTWAGSVQAVEYLCALKVTEENETAAKKNVVEMLDIVSMKLGNTRSVCKKYYVHPQLINLCGENQSLGELAAMVTNSSAYSRCEELLMHILEKTI